ncbi:calcium-translocating P-type ATPase, PMCA-type [Youxingia wuxianensis]|nr:calcium-translocating P-type ATPase, PMCA-type [Youxingia wuxianensis]
MPEKPHGMLSYSIKGLTPSQVESSRRSHGENYITKKKRNGFFHQFLASFGDPIIKVLLCALAINVIFLFRNFDWYESVGIAIAIFLATFVSTLSEYGSESAFIKLQEDAEKIHCRVKRAAGIVSLPVGEIVVGDIVLLQSGEKVPADGILISGELMVDQSALNGESKEAIKIPSLQEAPLQDLMAKNQLFCGSVVCSGDGAMVVRRVGDHTFYGNMAQEMQEETRESPLKKRLAELADTISKMGYMAAALVAAADLFNALVIDNGFVLSEILSEIQCLPLLIEDILHAATLAITVVVVAVPEGLPMMITVVLSSNMFRMLKDNVLVRKLVGIETSGNINILFTDKTGTLTKGKLEVIRFITGSGKEFKRASDFRHCRELYRWMQLSGFYNTASVVSQGCALGGNATDRALMDYMLPGAPPKYTKLEMLAFSSEAKFSAVHIKGEQDLYLVKGAPEKILSGCKGYYDEKGRVQSFTGKALLNEKWKDMTKNAVRVLAIASAPGPVKTAADLTGMTFIGLVGIRDEIRPQVKKSVTQAQQAGVQVVMITGDNRETAVAIARESGILPSSSPGDAVITSNEMASMSDGELKQILPRLRVVARALPTDKSRLVRLAQELNMVTGMTGDGINDAPALKKADVGFAMGSGTEVAKEAGDIVILDNNFASIAKAILYGRTIFKSIRKFIVFQLTMNLCAVGVSIIGPFIGIDTPVTVIQMLWINIIMDTLAGLAFAGEPPLKEYMKEKPKRREEPVLNSTMIHQIVWMGLFTIVMCVLFLKLEWVKEYFRYQEDSIYFMTAFFALFIFSGVFNSFNARTHRLNLFAHLWKNWSFIVIMAAVSAVQILLIYFGGSLFRTASLTRAELHVVLMIAFLVIPADLIRKLVLRFQGKQGEI